MVSAHGPTVRTTASGSESFLLQSPSTGHLRSSCSYTMAVHSTLKKHTAPDTRRQLHRQNPATVHIFSGIEGSFWVPFFHTGFCVKTCHQYFAFAAEPAPFPHQSNVDQVVWWLSGPAKKGAIRALGHPHTHLHQLCLGGEGRQRAENLCRRMAPFYAETGMQNWAQKERCKSSG